MANETPNRIHAGGLFVPLDPIPPPFTTAVVNQQGIQAFERLGVGQYLITLQRALAFHEGYADAALPANFQAVAGAQISQDGATVLLTVLALATGVPVDPPLIGCTVWSVREGNGDGPSVPFPPIPPPIPGGGGVLSFNGRVGAVVSIAGDYDAGQVDNDSGVPGATVADALDALSSRVVFFAVDENANEENYRVRQLGATGNFNFSFPVPDDFGTLIALDLVCTPLADLVAVSIDLASDYGEVGELITNTQEASAEIVSATGLEWSLLDLSPVFSALAAGDYCGVNVDHNGIGTSVDYLFVRQEYALA